MRETRAYQRLSSNYASRTIKRMTMFSIEFGKFLFIRIIIAHIKNTNLQKFTSNVFDLFKQILSHQLLRRANIFLLSE